MALKGFRMPLGSFSLTMAVGVATSLAVLAASPARAGQSIGAAAPRAPAPPIAVAPQYGTTHVYVARAALDRFVRSITVTFGGSASPPVTARITPTPSRTIFRAVVTPVGVLSVFGFETPTPYPFGSERTGYLVRDFDAAVAAARADGAAILVAPFADAVGRDVVIQWPGGANMQLYWHFKPSTRAPLLTPPENRIYLAPEAAPAFLKGFLVFAHGRVVSDDRKAPGIEIGRPNASYRRIRVASDFGNLTLLGDRRPPAISIWPRDHRLCRLRSE
jgi:hypothetical protein